MGFFRMRDSSCKTDNSNYKLPKITAYYNEPDLKKLVKVLSIETFGFLI